MARKIERGEIEAAALVPYANNARTHSDAQVDHLARIIGEMDFINPVVIDEKNELIAGHGRLLAAQKLGLSRVPYVRLIGFTDAQKMRFRIEDNSVADMSGWDMETLAAELEALEAEGYELDSFAFDDDIFKELESYFIRESDAGGVGMPALKSGEKGSYQQKTFTLHDEQAAIVDKAIKAAREMPESDTGLNENGNGNALALICEQWLRGNK